MYTNLNIAQDVIGQISFAIEQRPEAVAQLFADYGINAPVNEGSVLDAIVVFKDPFLGELNAIIEGGTDSILGIGKGKSKKANNQDEDPNKKKPLQIIKKIATKVTGKGAQTNPGGAPPPIPDPSSSPNPSPGGPSKNLLSNLTMPNIIEAAVKVNDVAQLSKSDNAIRNAKMAERNKMIDLDVAANTKLPNNVKEDKLFGMPKALAIGLIVVAILIVIFVIMRMRSK